MVRIFMPLIKLFLLIESLTITLKATNLTHKSVLRNLSKEAKRNAN